MVRANGRITANNVHVARAYESVVRELNIDNPPSLEEVIKAMGPRSAKVRSRTTGQDGPVLKTGVKSEARRIAAAMFALWFTPVRVDGLVGHRASIRVDKLAGHRASNVTLRYLPNDTEMPRLNTERIPPELPPEG